MSLSHKCFDVVYVKRLSATDPVAVVALLKELGVDERLSILIEGESLMNDGTAIVVFNVMLRALTNQSCCGAVDVLAWTLRLSLGGPLLGLFIGKVSIFFFELKTPNICPINWFTCLFKFISCIFFFVFISSTNK